jgi:hypothetical protein
MCVYTHIPPVRLYAHTMRGLDAQQSTLIMLSWYYSL